MGSPVTRARLRRLSAMTCVQTWPGPLPNERIHVVIAPPETAQSEGQVPVRYRVDPKNRKVNVEPERDLISEATHALATAPKARPKKKKRTKKAKKKSR